MLGRLDIFRHRRYDVRQLHRVRLIVAGTGFMIRRARFIARGPSHHSLGTIRLGTSDLPEHWLSCILTGLSFYVLLLLVEHLYQPLRSCAWNLSERGKISCLT